MLGDNRDNSNDSRFFGAVPTSSIHGEATMIWWSTRASGGGQAHIDWERIGTRIR